MQVSRRLLLTASGAALLTAGCTGQESDKESDAPSGGPSARPSGRPVDWSGALGVNFNSEPGGMRLAHLKDLSTGWVRGFVPLVPRTDRGPVTRQPPVATLLTAHEKGYATILSLKFPHPREALPEPGTSRMEKELARVDRVLKAVLGKVDILVIGNEPFIESSKSDRDGPGVNVFYEHVARHVIKYRKEKFAKGCRTRLYMGALTWLDDPAKRTGATRRWLEFVHDTREIEGVDIHPHVRSLEGSKQYLDYVVPRLREDQRFLATEFSLVHLWGDNMKTRIPAEFAEKWKMPPNLRVWQLLKRAAANPFPQAKWDDFLSMSPWFDGNKHYVRDQMAQFRATGKLGVATYGVVQGESMVKGIKPAKKPWLLNSLYATRTVRPTGTSVTGRNPAFQADFKSLQRKEDRVPVRTGEAST
ncbi:hypothetical protein [Streptomyces sp. NPDC048172]|uniref:hypothetical protein n=1 Tax=Streptomyces sp. NPDC048172 TaxID=3365505 RepID=UPI003717F7AE